MGLLHHLERRLRRFAIPRLTLLLVIGQAVLYLLSWQQGADGAERFILDMARVAEGEVWRLITFLFLPKTLSPLFIAFALYLFYLMGSALERQWGDFRFNLYIVVGYLATLASAFIPGVSATSNTYILGSVFLAFAWLYPDFQILLFFLLPVKMKWLALLTWILYALAFLFGDWPAKALVLAGVANFVIFFAPDILRRMRGARRRMETRIDRIKREAKPFHRCAACGITDRDDPGMEFRVCSVCKGGIEYCRDHIRNHAHTVDDDGI